MIIKRIKTIITNVVRELGFNLTDIMLFGSRARGNYNSESDYDILVILNENIEVKEKHKLTTRISNELHKKIKFTSFDIIVKSLKAFEEEKNIVNTVSNETFIEGISL